VKSGRRSSVRSALRREWSNALATLSTGGATVPEDIVEFAQMVGIVPDEWQADFLAPKEDPDHPRRILLGGRQVGKSTLGGLLAAHQAITVPDSVELITAPAEKQAKWLFRKAKAYWKRAGSPHGATSDRLTGLELNNGSIIECAAAVERTVRGPSVSLLVADECGGILDHDYYGGLMPTLIRTGGKQVLMGTARGQRGFFWETWEKGGEDWLHVKVRTDEIPQHIPPEVLDRGRRRLPDYYFRQEYLCEWLDTEGSLFRHEDIEYALAAGEHVEALHLEGEDEW
jgi:Terminase large subunit, T4likevirus-type, N-terminal